LAVIAGVVVIAIGVIILALQAAAPKPITATSRVSEGNAWGPASAPVKIVAYSDFGCSHCATFARQEEKLLRAAYEETGKVRYEYHHFIIGGDATANAANAAECAADQGKFWDYHDVLFSQQTASSDPFNKQALKDYAAQLGLDTTSFNKCVDAGQHLDRVYQDSSEGQAKGVDATPTFLINDKQKIVGAESFASFQAAIESALAQ
jgi:protein-disulfide isomerase